MIGSLGRVAAATLWITSLGLLGSCFSPSLEQEFRCTDGFCPAGFSCAPDGFCRRLERLDGGTSDADQADGAGVLGPFGDAVLVSALPAVAADPELSTNGLELFYRTGDVEEDTDISVSTRLATDGAFGPPQPVDTVNSNDGEFDPRLSADGLTLYFTRGDTEESDIFAATRAALDSSFSAASRIDSLVGPGASFSFSVSAIGEHAVFTSTRGSGNPDIFTARLVDGQWTNIEPAVELNTDDFDGSCELSADGLTVYFDSDRFGDRDLFVATRPTLDSPFAAPERLEELNSNRSDEDPSISADGRTIFFSSTRDGEQRIYTATRE